MRKQASPLDANWPEKPNQAQVKDRTCGEDHSPVHLGTSPTVMALLRETAVSVLHRVGCRASASRLRAHADQPHAALALVVGTNPTHT